jgi:hypothetical protein
MAVRRFETILVFSPIIAGALFVGYAVLKVHNDAVKLDASAVSAGFSDFAEQDLAKISGFQDPAAWRAHVAAANAAKKADAERLAAETAKKQRDWDAAAPQRAAAAAKEAADKIVRDENIRKAEAEGIERARLAAIPPGFKVTISGQSWKTGGFGSIGLMNFTLKNANDYQIKDVSLICTFYGNSGTELGSRTHTIYETIKANAMRSFAAVNIGFIPSQSSRGGCEVLAAVRI